MKVKDLSLKLIVVVFLAVCTVFLWLPKNARALPDSELNYQGRLTDSNGNVVSDGYYGIRFSIYTSSDASDSVWSETDNVYVRNGIFSTILGDSSSLNLDFNSSKYYIGIKVGSDSEMSPRSQIGAAPFSINSKKLNGNEAGTGANNILQLNSAGEVNIGGAIKTSTYLQADDGLNVSGGVDFSNATMSSTLNMNNHNISGVATVTAYGTNNILFNIGGTDIFQVGSSSVKIVPSSGVDLDVNNQSILNATYIEAGASQDLDLAVDGTDGILIHAGSANVEIMSGNLLLADHAITFDGNSSIIYDSGTSEFTFDTDGSMVFDIDATESFGIDVGGSSLFYADNSGFQFERDIDMMTNGLDRVQFVAIEDGQYVGLGTSDARFVFNNDTTDYINVSDAHLVMDSGMWIGLGAVSSKISFDPSSISLSTQINAGSNITFMTDNFIGFGGGAGDGRLYFTDNAPADDTISVIDADLDIESNYSLTWNTNSVEMDYDSGSGEFEIQATANIFITPDGAYNLTLGDLLSGDIIIGSTGSPGALDVTNRTIYLSKVTGDVQATSETAKITLDEGTAGSVQDALVVERLGTGYTGHALNVSSGDSYFAGDIEANNNIEMTTGHWIGLGAASGKLIFNAGATDNITVTSANLVVDTINPSGGASGTMTIGEGDDTATSTLNLGFTTIQRNTDLGNTADGTHLFQIQELNANPVNTTGLYVENRAFTNDGNYVAEFLGNNTFGRVLGITTRGGIVGNSSWSGQSTAAWTCPGGDECTLTISLDTNTRIEANDLIFITPITQAVGDRQWSIIEEAGNETFTVHSKDTTGVPLTETLDFNWMIIKTP